MKVWNQVVLVLSMVGSLSAFGAAEVGKPAPAFSAKNVEGIEVSLEKLKGSWIVLEWYNKDCPYVRKHYDSQNMQKLQESYTNKKVTWVSIISSAEGKQGFQTPEQAKAQVKTEKAKPTEIILDPSGTIGKAYGAKTTPHMFVINPEGKVVYAGAIDDNDSASPKVIPKSKNYVMSALDAGLAGKKIETASSKPYGCSVKY